MLAWQWIEWFCSSRQLLGFKIRYSFINPLIVLFSWKSQSTTSPWSRVTLTLPACKDSVKIDGKWASQWCDWQKDVIKRATKATLKYAKAIFAQYCCTALNLSQRGFVNLLWHVVSYKTTLLHLSFSLAPSVTAAWHCLPIQLLDGRDSTKTRVTTMSQIVSCRSML